MATILVADDEQDIVDLVRATLQQEGHRVISATTGSGAIELARMYAPDLALLDVSMPEGDGFVVASALSNLGSERRCPVIFLTARAEQRYESIGYEHGAVDYVRKPFEPDVLLRRVNNALQAEKRPPLPKAPRPRIQN